MIARNRIQGRAIAGIMVALVFAAAPLASADPIGLTIVYGPPIQQTNNSPCIIGDPSCPQTLTYTLLTPRASDGTLQSPVYTVDQIRNIIGGDVFYVGVDLNQAMGHNDGAYTIDRFTLAVDGITRFATSQATMLFPLNPGNGYSDATIMKFDMTGLSGSQTLQFTTVFSGATAGREQYFLRTVVNQAAAGHAPEPATMILLGSGLAGLAVYRRRRRSRSTPAA